MSCGASDCSTESRAGGCHGHVCLPWSVVVERMDWTSCPTPWFDCIYQVCTVSVDKIVDPYAKDRLRDILDFRTEITAKDESILYVNTSSICKNR